MVAYLSDDMRDCWVLSYNIRPLNVQRDVASEMSQFPQQERSLTTDPERFGIQL